MYVCRVGAAVVVEIDSPVIPPVFRNINGHSLCFIQYSDPSVPFESLNPNFVSCKHTNLFSCRSYVLVDLH